MSPPDHGIVNDLTNRRETQGRLVPWCAIACCDYTPDLTTPLVTMVIGPLVPGDN